MNDKFLKNLSQHTCSLFLADSKIGLEKESLRVDKNGTISLKMHPEIFGSSLTNKYITTDYSEALIEIVSPPCSSHQEALNYIKHIIGYIYKNLDGEYLWPASMPCIIAGDKSIPIAYYGTSNAARMKTTYRRGLGNRYGRVMQVISGIHFNYSFSDEFWNSYIKFKNSRLNTKDFKSEQYFIISRNLLRNDWMIAYLFGCSPAVCKSYLSGKKTQLESFDQHTYYEKNATSLRMGDIGYQNNLEENMGVHIDYNSLEKYTESLTKAIKEPSDEYKKIGVFSDGYYKQINENILQIENEYYSSVRPKPDPSYTCRPSKGLLKGGVNYIELRSIDNNIYTNTGIDLEQMYFIELLIIHSLIQKNDEISDKEYFEIKSNLTTVAHNGRDKNCTIKVNGKNTLLISSLEKNLEELKKLASLMDKITGDKNYKETIEKQIMKLNDKTKLPSNIVIDYMTKNKLSFYEYCMKNIEHQKKYFRDLDINTDIMNKLKGEIDNSLKKRHDLEIDLDESYETYIKNYFKD